jgi:hypothetical protein
MSLCPSVSTNALFLLILCLPFLRSLQFHLLLGVNWAHNMLNFTFSVFVNKLQSYYFYCLLYFVGCVALSCFLQCLQYTVFHFYELKYYTVVNTTIDKYIICLFFYLDTLSILFSWLLSF